LPFPLQQLAGVEAQEALALALKLVFATLQLELDHIANMALELAEALQGHESIGQQGDQGGCGCGGAVIGDQIADGGVIFMAHATHHRDGTCRDATGQLFAIEDGQILAAAPAPGQHQGINPQGLCLLAYLFNGATDLGFHGALHRNWHHDHLGSGPALGSRAEHVGQGRARHAREEGDPLGYGG
jgi:hypothetical protein